MPRLIDYVGRFEFIRQAAFAVVRDEGVDALSRRRVAAELGTGVNTIRRSVAGWADLTRLAADQVRSRRMLGRLGRREDEPLAAATCLVRSLMPEDATHLDEELVWLKLVAACALQPLQPYVAVVVATLGVGGLTLSACLGRLTPEHATELAIAHVIELGSGAGVSPDEAA